MTPRMGHPPGAWCPWSWTGGDPALAWSAGLSVKVGGAGTVAYAGVVLPQLLGDRIGLTAGLSAVLARAGFVPVRDRGRALVDAASALAAGRPV